MELTCGADAVSGNNFDSLMVPFRCIAADVYNKRAVVLGRGNLGQAVRASMAYPLYFEPVILDSVLLFDGGIYNNFPFETLLEEFSPSFIIGSKVANRTPRPGKDDLMLQLENMIMQETNYSIPDSTGIVIETRFQDVSLLDFESADSLIEQGYRNAKRYIERILPNVEKLDEASLNDKRAAFREAMPAKLFTNIYLSGITERQEEYITKLLFREQSVFDINQLKSEYFRLLSEENVQQAYPRAQYNPDNGTYDLYLDIKLKEAYSLSMGGLISLTTYSQIFIGFNYHHLTDIFNMFSANIYLGQYYSSFNMAHRIMVPQKNSVVIDFSLTGNRWNYFTNESPKLFYNLSPTYAIRNERLFRASVGLPAGNNSLFKTGLSFSWIEDEYYQAELNTENPIPDNSEYFYAGANISFESNMLNRRQFASSGNSFYASLQYHTGLEYYIQGQGDTIVNDQEWINGQGWFTIKILNENYSRLGQKFVMGSLVDLNLSNMKTGNNYTSTLVNSYKFEPTLFSRQVFGKNLRANSYLGGGIMPVYEFGREFNLRGGLFVFLPVRSIEEGSSGVNYGDYFDEIMGIAELGIVYHTPVGPFSAGLNYFTHGENKLFYFLNFGYILFNKKGLE
jgi:NTE family protein